MESKVDEGMMLQIDGAAMQVAHQAATALVQALIRAGQVNVNNAASTHARLVRELAASQRADTVALYERAAALDESRKATTGRA